jgi:hypothetical protein
MTDGVPSLDSWKVSASLEGVLTVIAGTSFSLSFPLLLGPAWAKSSSLGEVG